MTRGELKFVLYACMPCLLQASKHLLLQILLVKMHTPVQVFLKYGYLDLKGSQVGDRHIKKFSVLQLLESYVTHYYDSIVTRGYSINIAFNRSYHPHPTSRRSRRYGPVKALLRSHQRILHCQQCLRIYQHRNSKALDWTERRQRHQS